MGIISPQHLTWANAGGHFWWWLFFPSKRSHTQVLCMQAQRQKPCMDYASFWWANKISAPATSQTQALQLSGPAGGRWRHKGGREDNVVQVQTRSVLKHLPIPTAGQLQFTTILGNKVMYIRPYVLRKQPVTQRVECRRAKTINLPQLSAVVTGGQFGKDCQRLALTDCALGNKTNFCMLQP